MRLAEVLQKRIKPRKEESDDEAVVDTDAVVDASDSNASFSAENTNVESGNESGDKVRSYTFLRFALAHLTLVRNR